MRLWHEHFRMTQKKKNRHRTRERQQRTDSSQEQRHHPSPIQIHMLHGRRIHCRIPCRIPCLLLLVPQSQARVVVRLTSQSQASGGKHITSPSYQAAQAAISTTPHKKAHEALRRPPGETQTAHTCVFTTDGGSQVLGEAYASANMGTRAAFLREHQGMPQAEQALELYRLTVHLHHSLSVRV